jgi:hypothetical protein
VGDPTRRSRDAVNEVFGESLPQKSTDERDDPAPGDIAERDRWLRENMPPHHS